MRKQKISVKISSEFLKKILKEHGLLESVVNLRKKIDMPIPPKIDYAETVAYFSFLLKIKELPEGMESTLKSVENCFKKTTGRPYYVDMGEDFYLMADLLEVSCDLPLIHSIKEEDRPSITVY